MLHYIIQTIAFQVFFLLVYDVVLRKETFFNWNRVYLLVTALLSFILPFVKIESFKEVVPKNFIITLPEVVLGEANNISLAAVNIEADAVKSTSLLTWGNVFYLGVFVAFTLFLVKLIKIILLIYKNPKTRAGKLNVVHILKSTSAFSFFNYIFLGEQLNEDEKATILKHEMVHVRQNHTLDLLFFEVFRIVFWFNPLVYFYQKRMMILHEFIADADAVKHLNKTDYYQNLLSQVFNTKQISFINPFYKQSLIKKRIVMLQKSKSKQINLLKYALLIPLVTGMLLYTSCYKEETKSIDHSELTISKQVALLKSSIESKSDALTEKEKQDLLLLGEVINKSKSKVNLLKSPLGDKSIDNEVPFSVIDQVPIFPECEGMSNEKQRDCMSKNISNHVSRNFNTKLANELNLVGRQRINVIFKINTEGKVVDVRARAQHPGLEEEATRVIKLLPGMIPGEHNGKKVNVPYSLPIIFEVAETKAND